MSCSINGKFIKQKEKMKLMRFYFLGHVFYIFCPSHSNEYASTISVFVLFEKTKSFLFEIFFRQIISLVLGDLQFNFYHRWFDCIFLLSALFSIGILYLHYRSSQQSISLYDKNVQKVELI
jgi:hypothetical protein